MLPLPLPTPACTQMRPPALIVLAGPEYPEIARQQGAVGLIVVDFIVDRNGRAVSVAIERSARNAALDASALEAARSSRYDPASCGDETVVSGLRFSTIFTGVDGASGIVIAIDGVVWRGLPGDARSRPRPQT